MVPFAWPGAAAAQGTSPPSGPPAAAPATPAPGGPAQGPATGAQCVPACRSGYICVQGQCVSACNPPCPAGQQCTAEGECVAAQPSAVAPAPAPAPATAPAPAGTAPAAPASAGVWTSSEAAGKPASTSANKRADFNIDVLGLLFFGPTPMFEFGGQAAFSIGLRLASAGGLTYVVSDNLAWALGARIAFRYYFGTDGNMRGFFFGPELDYVHVVENGCGGYSYGYFQCVTEDLIPEFGAGYRWAWDTFQLTVGGRLGYIVPVQWNYDTEPTRSVYGEPFIDVGWYF